MKPLEFIFRCKNWPSRNETDAMMPKTRARAKRKWMGKGWRGELGVIKAAWHKAGRPVFKKCKLEITMFFKIKRKRDRDNYAAKWLQDALQDIGVILGDHAEVLDYHVDFENASENYAVVRIVEVE